MIPRIEVSLILVIEVWLILVIKGSDYCAPQDWEDSASKFIEDRVASSKRAIENKLKNAFGSYVSKTNRWDLESFKLDLSAYMTRRFSAQHPMQD